MLKAPQRHPSMVLHESSDREVDDASESDATVLARNARDRIGHLFRRLSDPRYADAMAATGRDPDEG